MASKHSVLCVISAFATTVGGLWATVASAQTNVPAVIPVQGFVTDGDGTPIHEPELGVQLQFRLYAGQTGLEELYSEAQVVPVSAGRFVAFVGDKTPIPLGLFRDNAELWVQVEIDGDTELPRFRLGSVPFAAASDYAHHASWSGVEGIPTDLQDGDDVLERATVEGYARGVCFDSEAELTSVLDDHYAGIGDFLPAGRVLACGGSQKVRGIDAASGNVLCALDSDTNTTYSAAVGGGLVLAGTSFSLAAGGVASSHLADDSVTSVKIRDGEISLEDLDDRSVDSAKIVDGSITADDLGADSVTATQLANRSVNTSKIVNGAVTAPKLDLHEGAASETYVLSEGTQWLFPVSFTARRRAACHVSVHAQSPASITGTPGWSLFIARRVGANQTAFPQERPASAGLDNVGAIVSGSWRVPVQRNQRVGLGARIDGVSGSFVGANLVLSVSYLCI